MAAITLRADLLRGLTNAEIDANFTNLNNQLGLAMYKANNLSDVANAATARTNLGLQIGLNVQAWDADLDAIAALAGTAGFLKKTAANTWLLDTSTYLTGITSAQVTGALGFTPLSNATSYLPLSGGTLTGTLQVGNGTAIAALYADNSNAGIGIEAFNAGNTVKKNLYLNAYGGNVTVGTVSDGGYKLNVAGTVNATGALTQAGNQVLHATNYSTYALPLSGGTVIGQGYFRRNQANGDYTSASLWTESYGTTTTGIAFHISGTVGKYLEMRTNGILYWNSSIILNDSNYQGYSAFNGTVSGTKGTFSSGAIGVGTNSSLNVTGDITTTRGPNAGVLYFGTNGTSYIQADGSGNYYLGGGSTVLYLNGSSVITAGTIGSQTAGGISNFTASYSSNPINPDSPPTYDTVGYCNSVSLFGQTDGGLYTAGHSTSWYHQIYGDFRTGQIAIRGKNSGTWQAWRTVIDSTNYSNYASPIWYQGWVTNPGWDANTLPGSRSGFTYANNAPRVGAIVHFDAGGYGLQLNGSYSGDGGMAFRNRNGDSNTWNAWKTVLTDANYSSYALPLSGGNVSYIGLNNASAINFRGAGSGTYNTSWIYSDSGITSWEAPLTTDSAGGAKVPFTLTWRGGYSSQGGLKLTGGSSGELGGNVILHAGNYTNYSASIWNTVQSEGGVARNNNGSSIDTLTTTGFWRGSSMSGAPDTGWWHVVVQSHDISGSAGWVKQTATAFGAGNSVPAGTTFTRVRQGGSSWDAWIRDIDSNGGTLTGTLYLPNTSGAISLYSGYTIGMGDWGIRNTTPYGWIQLGPANASVAHIYTDRPSFYFNKELDVNGNRVLNAGNFTSYTYATKAWVSFNGVGTVSIRASGNVSSITDNGVGDFTVNFSSGFADANYSSVYMGQQTATSSYSAWQTGMISQQVVPTASACRIITLNNNTWTDSPINNLTFTR